MVFFYLLLFFSLHVRACRRVRAMVEMVWVGRMLQMFVRRYFRAIKRRGYCEREGLWQAGEAGEARLPAME